MITSTVIDVELQLSDAEYVRPGPATKNLSCAPAAISFHFISVHDMVHGGSGRVLYQPVHCINFIEIIPWPLLNTIKHFNSFVNL